MWYYAVAGQQMGPVTREELVAMLRSGQLKADTLAWREGMANWLPAAAIGELQADQPPAGMAPAADPPQLPPLRPMPAAAEAAKQGCSQCGRSFAESDLFLYQGQRVCPACREALLQRLRGGLAGDTGCFEYAGFWIRVLASILDGAILFGFNIVIMLPLSLLSGLMSHADSVIAMGVGLMMLFSTMICQMLVALCYQGYFLSRHAATPGKMALGLKVLRPDGSRVSFLRGTCRSLATSLSAWMFCIGYLMVAFDSEKRALHDYMCDTRVVRS